jgi:hypothetical protein
LTPIIRHHIPNPARPAMGKTPRSGGKDAPIAAISAAGPSFLVLIRALSLTNESPWRYISLQSIYRPIILRGRQ